MTPIPIATGLERERAAVQVIVRREVPLWAWALIAALGIIVLMLVMRR